MKGVSRKENKVWKESNLIVCYIMMMMMMMMIMMMMMLVLLIRFGLESFQPRAIMLKTAPGNLPHFTILRRVFIMHRCSFHQLTRMPYSSVCLSVLSVTKNPGHFSSYRISQTWSNGFLHSFQQYFSPPDFDISCKLSDFFG